MKIKIYPVNPDDAKGIFYKFRSNTIRFYRNRICIHSCWFKSIEKADRFVFESIGLKYPYETHPFEGAFFV